MEFHLEFLMGETLPGMQIHAHTHMLVFTFAFTNVHHTVDH